MRVRRSSLRRCSSALLVLGVASPMLVLLATGGLPSWGHGASAARAIDLPGSGRALAPSSTARARLDVGATDVLGAEARGGVAAAGSPEARARLRGGDVLGVDARRDPATDRGSVPDVVVDRSARRDARPASSSDAKDVAGASRTPSVVDDSSSSDDDPDPYAAEDAEDELLGTSSDDADWLASADLDDDRCSALADEWIASRDSMLATREANGKSDMIFFLHIPRTAGRTYHFCYLKLAYPEPRRCAKSYDELRVDVHHPNCDMLASHDDYSLVERFERQPRVVTMLRDPVDRFLSSYEFAVEVSVRSFGQEAQVASSRVSTRNVWPWADAVRYIDGDLRRYKKSVDEGGPEAKRTITNVYDNSVYTPLREFVDLPLAHVDLHNGQFLQLLGLTNNSNPETEPHAAKLRACLRRGGEGAPATEALYEYAERRLRDEVDVTVTHERLDEAMTYSSAALGLHTYGPSYNGAGHAPKHSVILHRRMKRLHNQGEREAPAGRLDDGEDETARTGGVEGGAGGDDARANDAARGDGASERGGRRPREHGFATGSSAVGFVFRFGKVTGEQLARARWREGYLDALAAVLAHVAGVRESDVTVIPSLERTTGPRGDDWRATGPNGFQAATIEWRHPDRGELKEKLGPDAMVELLSAAIDAKSDAATDLVSAAEGFDSYGELTIHAVSWRVRGAAPETRRLGEDPKFVPLGEAFRTCERAQRNKYARLKSKAFKSLHKHVDGDFEPFVHADREKIPDALIERIRKINHLDVRLHAFAKKLFDERFEERRLDVAEEILPKALPL